MNRFSARTPKADWEVGAPSERRRPSPERRFPNRLGARAGVQPTRLSSAIPQSRLEVGAPIAKLNR